MRKMTILAWSCNWITTMEWVYWCNTIYA